MTPTFKTLGTAAALLVACAAPAAGQAVYHTEKDPRYSFYDWHKAADKGNAQIEAVSGIYNNMLEDDIDMHAFAWKDGYTTKDGEPTYTVQMGIHRHPRTFTRIPTIGVEDGVYLARNVRNPEWRIPMQSATFYVFPERANPGVDKPLAVVSSTNKDEGFRSRATGLTWRRFLVKAVVTHYGVENDKRIEFQRTYTFRTPTVDLEDGRHEPYELYHWFH